MADTQAREAAVASTEQQCPRCGALREPRQEYCVECGLRLPPVSGVIPVLRRRWIRRFGWYPGDWIWTSALTFCVAAAGAGVAIAVTGGNAGGGSTYVASPRGTSGGSTSTAPTATTATTGKTTTLPTAPEPTIAKTTTRARTTPTTKTTTTKTTPAKTTPTRRTPPAAPNGRTVWPPGHSGWTLVLISYPVTGGRGRALAAAARAARGGLPQAGVLDSGDFGSLHPGYYVAFSGIYDSQSQTESALALARARGFTGAYPRQISP